MHYTFSVRITDYTDDADDADFKGTCCQINALCAPTNRGYKPLLQEKKNVCNKLLK